MRPPPKFLRSGSKLAEKYLTEERSSSRGHGGPGQAAGNPARTHEGQKGRHQGGKKWIGTAGTSPFGAYGYNPEGIRIGQEGNRNFARSRFGTGASSRIWTTRSSSARATSRSHCADCVSSRAPAHPKSSDLDGTIKGTAHKGYLDILMRPERHNAVKVLLFFDVGGSLDWHIKATEELFSAARTEFKHMEHLYFDDCLYEKVWKQSRRRFDDHPPTWDVLHTYPHELQGHLRRRRVDVALRDHGAGRLGGALQ